MSKEKNTRPVRPFPQDSYAELLLLFHPDKMEDNALSIQNAFEVFCFFTDTSMYNSETAFFLYQLMRTHEELRERIRQHEIEQECDDE